MATIESRNGKYRVAFRFRGKRYTRSLRTTSKRVGHLKRHFDLRLLLGELQLTHIQDYVNKRAKEQGIRGRTLSPATIKKELVTLTTAWRWAQEIR